MQTLGLSDSTPRTESRLKALFWPSIQTANDVDYLGTQGYWICTVLAVFSFIVLVVFNFPISGLLVFLFYYLGGIGVRERSRYAATIVFALYALDTLAAGLSVIRVIFLGLLLSNVRATWIAANWVKGSDEAVLPPRLNETIGDKLADTFPQWLWPRMRILYYIFSAGFLLWILRGMILLRLHQLQVH